MTAVEQAHQEQRRRQRASPRSEAASREAAKRPRRQGSALHLRRDHRDKGKRRRHMYQHNTGNRNWEWSEGVLIVLYCADFVYGNG